MGLPAERIQRGDALGRRDPKTNPKAKRKQSQQQERRVAQELDGRTTPGSGCLPGAKGDVEAPSRLTGEGFLVEAKRTEHASISLKAEWLAKIEREALATGREPALALELNQASGLLERDWIVIPLRVFRQLCRTEE